MMMMMMMMMMKIALSRNVRPNDYC